MAKAGCRYKLSDLVIVCRLVVWKTSTNGPSELGMSELWPMYYADVGNNFGGLRPEISQRWAEIITASMPVGTESYHDCHRSWSGGLPTACSLRVAYTFSHMIDNSTADFTLPTFKRVARQ